MEKEKGTGLGLAGFILSLIAIMGILFPIVSYLFGIIGVALSIGQLIRKRTGLAIAGLVIGLLALMLGVIYLYILQFNAKNLVAFETRFG
jgi:hypothetical protein